MNKYGQHNKLKTQTKRQRKTLNESIKQSIKNGVEIVMSGRVYVGANPVYTLVTRQDGSKWWLKSVKGIPFVRVA